MNKQKSIQVKRYLAYSYFALEAAEKHLFELEVQRLREKRRVSSLKFLPEGIAYGIARLNLVSIFKMLLSR